MRKTGPKPVPSVQRFWPKVLRTDYCWLWIGNKHRSGYGLFGLNKQKTVQAHRFSYELFKGPIPAGLVLDHLCLTPACVNPDHLEAITVREHVLRGMSPMACQARQTHCKRGHPLEGENVRIWRGMRFCRICHATRAREWRRRRNGHQASA